MENMDLIDPKETNIEEVERVITGEAMNAAVSA